MDRLSSSESDEQVLPRVSPPGNHSAAFLGDLRPIADPLDADPCEVCTAPVDYWRLFEHLVDYSPKSGLPGTWSVNYHTVERCQQLKAMWGRHG